MKVLLASNNKGKINEFKEIFNAIGIEILSLGDVGLAHVDVEETGKTFAENSMLKAKEIYDLAKIPVIADDSGLVIDALSGRNGLMEYPGLYTKREFADFKNDSEANTEVIRLLKNSENRDCRYKIVLTYYDGETVKQFEGSCEGEILQAEIGTQGFAFDPIFFSKELKKSFGIASSEEKRKVSHRGIAINKLVEFFKNKL